MTINEGDLNFRSRGGVVEGLKFRSKGNDRPM